MSDLPPPPPPGGGTPTPPPPPPPPGGFNPPPPPPPGGGFVPPPPPPPPGGGFNPPPPPQPPGGGYTPGGGYVPPAPMGYMPGAVGYAQPRTDGLAIASLIVGIVGVVCFFLCLGIVAGPTAAIMGFVSRQRITSSGGMLGGGGMALAGLILGIVGFVASVSWFFFIVLSGHTNTTTGLITLS
ncbi:MAG TPA: DUF4190 domain-containing protein [Candidatus Nitrosopolaris sp.]|nr:DUF4190 domain-containing protein [Candidatus Nitrosopolaris sp.]